MTAPQLKPNSREADAYERWMAAHQAREWEKLRRAESRYTVLTWLFVAACFVMLGWMVLHA